MRKRNFAQIYNFLFILVSLTLPVIALTQSRNITFDHLSPDDGLAQVIVGAIIRDSRGFMWFGTRGGLNRYDGYKFELYENDAGDPHSISSSSIHCLFEDHLGVLWVGTSNGLNKFDHKTDRFTVYKDDPGDPGSISGKIVRSIIEDCNNVLWIGTYDGGLNKFDRETGRFVHFRHNPTDLNSLSSDHVEVVYVDLQRSLWVGTAKGLNRLISFQSGQAIFAQHRHDPADASSLSGSHICSIFQDYTGTLWVGTRYNGLNEFDRNTGKAIRYRHDSGDRQSLGKGAVWAIHEDKENILWVGCYGGGLNRFDRENKRFIRFKHDPANPGSLCGDMVVAIHEDPQGALWIGTWGNGVSKYDRDAAKFRLYTHDPSNRNSLGNWNVRAICEDRESPGRVFWIGTRSGGLSRFDRDADTWTHFRHDPGDASGIGSDAVSYIHADAKGILWVGTQEDGLNRFNPETETFSVFKNDPADPDSLSNNQVRTIAERPEGVLWIGTSNGLNKFEVGTGTFTRYLHDPANPGSLGRGICQDIHVDKTGNIWIGHRGGGLDRFDPGSETFTHYLHEQEDGVEISDNDVWCIIEDPTGILWLGTGKGLNKFNPRTGASIRYRKKDGLSSDTILGILQDNGGALWLGTRGGGLCRFDSKTGECKSYNSSDGLQSNEMSEGCACKSRRGELFFGGLKGMNSFYPENITDNPYIPPVMLTDFRIFNKPVPIGDRGHILSRHIGETEDIRLPPNVLVFSLEFAALNYRSPEKNRYSYIMENFETRWNNVDYTRRFVTYTNLKPGNYVFRVKATNNDGVWNETGKSLKITILPYWWNTLWARLLVLLFVIGAIIAAFKIKTYRLNKRSKELQAINDALNGEIAERKKLEKKLVRQERMAVLGELAGGIAHELRNPLGAMKNSVYYLNMTLEASEAEAKESLQILDKEISNSERIISSLLNYAQAKPAVKKKTDVKEIIRHVLLNMELPANIRVDSRVAESMPAIMADAGQLTQVFENILLNAVQAMPEGGRLSVFGESGEPGWLKFSIADTGMGISEENTQKIFEPLFSTKIQGIGLGMAITKAIVNGHGGRLEVESKEGQGTIFTVKLPVQAGKQE